MSRTRAITRPFAGIASGLLALSGALVAAGAIITSSAAPAGATITKNFAYTGAEQTWTVPVGVTSITMTVLGAQGGNGSVVPEAGPAGLGGSGGRTIATIAVTPGEVLHIFVGGQGTGSPVGSAASGGFNGGGDTGTNADGEIRPGSGGGASDVRQGGNTLANRIIVAGGGGGAGGLNAYGNGGNGGQTGQAGSASGVANTGTPGDGGTNAAGGTGGTGATAGGVACTANGGAGGNGALGVGGVGGAPGGPANLQSGGGGGGGGFYGGGGGGGACDQNRIAGSGGGGSGYADASATGVSYATGVRSGNGLVTFAYTASVATTMAVTSNNNPSALGDNVTFTATVTWNNGGTPTPVGGGTVSFLNGASPIAGCQDVAVDSIGHAECTTSALPLGANTINATFSGHDIYDATTATPITQTVLRVASITLTPSANPITEGDTLTLTVTVSGSGPTPTGTIDVVENTCRARCRAATRTPRSIGTCNNVALVAGTATCTVSTLPIGDTELFVDYLGDSNYAVRFSAAAYVQIVTQAPTPTTAAPNNTAGGATRGGRIASTGADSISLALVGMALASIGGAFMLLARRLRRPTA